MRCTNLGVVYSAAGGFRLFDASDQYACIADDPAFLSCTLREPALLSGGRSFRQLLRCDDDAAGLAVLVHLPQSHAEAGESGDDSAVACTPLLAFVTKFTFMDRNPGQSRPL
jgi:hypothetical protein